MIKQYHERWLAPAKKLGVGRRGRLDCPQCGWGTGTNAAIVNHNPKYYSCYCNACGLVRTFGKGILSLAELRQLRELEEIAKKPLRLELPHDYTLDIPEIGRQWLYKCGLSPSYWQRLGIGWSNYYQRVVLPVYNHERVLVWYQLRAVHEGQKPKYIQPSAGKNCVYTVFKDLKPAIAIVVEDIASAMRINLLPLNVAAYAIMGTSLSAAQLATLSGHQKVYTWFDPDIAGRRADKKVRKTLGLWVDTCSIKSDVDPKKLTNQELTNAILSAGWKA